MKQIIMLSSFLSIFIISYSQDTVKLYLDKDFIKTEKEKAVVIRKATISNNRYCIIDQFINGNMINYGEYISVNPFVEDGLSKHYEYGRLYSTGKYKYGKISGKWIYYLNRNAPDTVDYTLVENYYKYLIDSCKRNQSLIDDTMTTNEVFKIKEDLKYFINNNIRIPARTRDIMDINEINISLTLDTDGLIKCPVIKDSNQMDFSYEALRILFLYKSNIKIKNPIKLTIPVIFDNEPTFVIVEENATFHGGNINDFRLYIQKNLVYPLEARKAKIQGKVIVQFAVNSKGFVVNAKVLRGINPLLDKEAVRCIENSPKWESPKQGGKTVKQQFVVPIIFSL